MNWKENVMIYLLLSNTVATIARLEKTVVFVNRIVHYFFIHTSWKNVSLLKTTLESF